MTAPAAPVDKPSFLSDELKSKLALLSGEEGPHAVLLYGEEGGPGLEAADFLTRRWLSPTPDRLVECPVAKSFEGGRAVDFQPIFPWGAGNQIKGDAIRRESNSPSSDPFPGASLDEFFRTRPLMARNRVVRIHPAERMYGPPQNALLKTLEEPPSFGRLVLVTHSIASLLPTVRSRCLTIAVPLPSLSEIEAKMGALTEAEKTFGENSPGVIERIRKAPNAYETLLEAVRAAPTLGPGAALGLSEKAKNASEELGDALEWGARQASLEALRALGAGLRQTKLATKVGAVLPEYHRLVQGNVRADIIFDALFLDLLA